MSNFRRLNYAVMPIFLVIRQTKSMLTGVAVAVGTSIFLKSN